MMTKDISVKVKKIVAKVLEIPVDKVLDNSSQKTIQNWDSLAHLNLVMELEKEFDIAFDTQEVFTMETVEEICKLVKKHLP